jgi:hypothetical protein
MDDTSSLPVTHIINLSYDRSKKKLGFFFFYKKKTDQQGEKKRKDLQRSRITGMNSTKDQTQAIKSNCLISVSHTKGRREKKGMGSRQERRRKKGMRQRRKKVRSRRGQSCRKFEN